MSKLLDLPKKDKLVKLILTLVDERNTLQENKRCLGLNFQL